jgi:hypothetical protein
MDIIKVLEFKPEYLDRYSKYAHPWLLEDGTYEWGSSELPMLMQHTATIEGLKKLYPGANFDMVNLVKKKLVDID